MPDWEVSADMGYITRTLGSYTQTLDVIGGHTVGQTARAMDAASETVNAALKASANANP